MARTIVAYDIVFAESAEELDRLTREKIADDWVADGIPKDKVEKDAMTGKNKFIYWQAMVKYSQTND